MKKIIVIPARYKSSRFPGKPLKKIHNRELILRVADRCLLAINRENIYIATENIKIAKLVKKNNLKVIMTSNKCLTGTDRVAEASRKVKSNIYINVQGDEPLINHLDIKKIIKAKKKYPNHVICGYAKIGKKEKPQNLDIPKVVFNSKNELIYISRAPLPASKNKIKNKVFYKQVCIYAYNKNELNKFYSQKKNLLLKKMRILSF